VQCFILLIRLFLIDRVDKYNKISFPCLVPIFRMFIFTSNLDNQEHAKEFMLSFINSVNIERTIFLFAVISFPILLFSMYYFKSTRFNNCINTISLINISLIKFL
jgi:hypothetical protein